MKFQDLKVERRGAATWITINRPERHNAIRVETYEELARALEDAAGDDSVRSVVLTGAGDQAFTTGGDAQMAGAVLTNVQSARQHMQRVMRVSDPILRMDKPVIAAVNGLATGSGVEIMMFCDFVIAAEHASFGFSGTDIGLCLGWGPHQLLPLQVGLRRAEEIIYLSRRVDAAEAERIGLVNRVVPAAQLSVEADALCARLVAMPAAGIRTNKAALRATKQVMLSSMEATLELCADTIAGPDAQSVFAAMLSGQLDHEKVRWMHTAADAADAPSGAGTS